MPHAPSSSYLGDVEALDVAHGVQREISRERHRQIVPQGQQLAPLVREVVDELRVLAVLARERLAQQMQNVGRLACKARGEWKPNCAPQRLASVRGGQRHA